LLAQHVGMVAKIQTAFRHIIGLRKPRLKPRSSGGSGQLSALIHPSAWKGYSAKFA
jgi:hypothetical protein